MPSVGLHLSSNMYICPKGNTPTYYKLKLFRNETITLSACYPLSLGG